MHTNHCKKSILIVPCCEPGKGGGHLTRCISLTCDLRALGTEAFLFMTEQTRDLSSIYNSLNFNPKWCITKPELEIRINNLSERFSLIVLDRFQTPHDELLGWKKIAPVIGIDEGGDFREQFDFLIDILIPEKMGKPRANIANPGLIKFTKDITQRTAGSKGTGTGDTEKVKILISFGQEDPAGLGVKTAHKLSVISKKQKMDITSLRGALSGNTIEVPSGVKIIEAIPNLAQHLFEYDLVITHYGLTAYEAVYAGVPVLLAHPTKLHKKLAKAAGFKTFNIDKVRGLTRKDADYESKIKKICDNQEGNLHQSTIGSVGVPRKSADNNIESLAELVNSFTPLVNRQCSVCGAESTRDTARFSERTYRRCKKCGIIFMDRICPPPIEYEKEYFFESYKKQYGKTYLEDFENIKNAGKNRLKKIKKLCDLCVSAEPLVRGLREKNENPSLLDIGCAYGPFLSAANEAGFSPYGLDPAEDAVKYVNEKLGIPAIHSFFPAPCPTLPAPFDVITLWFVIEHFTDCASVLAEVKKILKPNGILAFSTPSFSGISGRKALRNFLSNSPADHFTVWSPKSAKKALSLAGLKVKKIAVVGHHPERFPVFGKLAKTNKSPMYWLLLAISKLFGLGDTFEVYAQG